MILNLFCVRFPEKVESTPAPYGFKPLIHFFFQFLGAQVMPGSGDAQ